jgi:hypothetical protein
MNTWYQAAGNPSDYPPYNRLIISAFRARPDRFASTPRLLQRITLDEILDSGFIFRGDVNEHEADLGFLA